MKEIRDVVRQLDDEISVSNCFHTSAQADFGGALAQAVGMLDDLRIPYLLIGSNALHAYRYTRATKDIDLAIDYGDLAKIIGAGPENWGFRRVETPENGVDEAQLIHSSGVKIEFMVFRPELLDIGLDEDESELVEVHGKQVVVPSLGLLFAYKLQAWRPKDQLDVMELYRANPQADYDRVRSAIMKHPNGEELLRRFEDAVSRLREDESRPVPSVPKETREERRARRTRKS